MKRPFVRDHGQLIDKFEGPDGTPTASYVPACMLGEEPSAEEREEFLSDLGSGSRTEYESIRALNGETSQEYVNALLKSLEAGNISAPMSVTRFLDDPRVQPALVESTRMVSLEHLANFAQVVGLVGGPGAREVLRERLSELLEDPKTFRDDKFVNRHAGSLQSVAEALLKLEPDAEDFANVLIRLLDHPCSFNRESAVSTISDVLNNELCLGVRRLLGTALEKFLSDDNPALFLRAALALSFGEPEKVLSRIEIILAGDNEKLRRRAVGLLTQAPSHIAPKVISLLIKRLEDEISIRLRVEMVKYLRGVAPLEAIQKILKTALDDESPSLRLESIKLLELLEADEASRLAEQALEDEPDDMLKTQLSRHISH